MRVKLFAKFREIANADYIDIEASNIKELKEKLSAILKVNVQEIIVMINGKKLPEDEVLYDVKEAIAFPPTAGGC
ncbi:MAG: MoaD/ThiS family protein [Nitrososphaeria archaeon]